MLSVLTPSAFAYNLSVVVSNKVDFPSVLHFVLTVYSVQTVSLFLNGTYNGAVGYQLVDFSSKAIPWFTCSFAAVAVKSNSLLQFLSHF